MSPTTDHPVEHAAVADPPARAARSILPNATDEAISLGAAR
ncbi:hypothetical protein ACWC2K_26635 [Streptomyces chattanoogensis]